MAEWGLRLWNTAGNLTLDYSDDTGRLGGLKQVPAGNGTINFQVSAGKTPFFYPVLSGNFGYSWSYSNGVFSFYMQTGGYVYYGEA